MIDGNMGMQYFNGYVDVEYMEYYDMNALNHSENTMLLTMDK